MFRSLLTVLLLSSALVAQEPLRVVTSLPWLAELVEQIGGSDVSVEALAPPGEDPHGIQLTPSQASALRKADAFIENGVSLEIWADDLLEASGNAAIQRGARGHLYAASGIGTLDRPAADADQEGHSHAGGNPHVWLDPANLKPAARNVEGLLARLRPSSADAFAARREAFEATLNEKLYGAQLVEILGPELLDRLHANGRLRSFLEQKTFGADKKPLATLAGGWLEQAWDLAGSEMFAFHATWRYLEVGFGFRVVGNIEEKPGIPASPAHLGRLQEIATERGVKAIILAPYYPVSRAEGLAERIGGRVMVLPTQPGEVDGADDLFALYDELFARLRSVLEE